MDPGPPIRQKGWPQLQGEGTSALSAQDGCGIVTLEGPPKALWARASLNHLWAQASQPGRGRGLGCLPAAVLPFPQLFFRNSASNTSWLL